MNTLRGNGNKKYRGPKIMEMTGQKKKLIREKGWFYVGFENLSPFSAFCFVFFFFFGHASRLVGS